MAALEAMLVLWGPVWLLCERMGALRECIRVDCKLTFL